MTIAIVGSARFLGRWILEHLRASKYDAVGIDDRPSEFCDVRVPSILNRRALEEALRGAEVVVHAYEEFSQFGGDARRLLIINGISALACAEAAVRAGARRLILLSSGEVYGLPFTLPVDETHAAIADTPYGASKLSAEALAIQAVARAPRPAELIILRIFDAYGPMQEPERCAGLGRMVAEALRGGELPVPGDGSQVRDPTYIEDVALAVEACIKLEEPPASPLILNISGGSPITLAELAKLVAKAAGVPARLRPMPELGRWAPSRYAEIRRAKAILSWEPRYSPEEGVRKTVRWFRMWAEPGQLLSEPV